MSQKIAVFAVVALAAGCSSQKGADTLKQLSDEVVDGLGSRDDGQVLDLLLDADAFVSVCEERFQTDSVEDFKRRLDNNRRRMKRRLTQCKTKLGDDLEVLDVSGGRKKSRVAGCGGHVWHHTDVRVMTESDGRKVELLLIGVVGMQGRYYILDQIFCR